MTLDAREFRNALGNFATGVTIVTTLAETGERLGITANSFNSVSLDPPLVLWSLGRNAFSLPAFETSGRFAINILADDQQSISTQFAKAGADKWAGVDIETLETGCPIVKHCLAAFDCRTHAVHDGGDHLLFLGRVVAMRAEREARPLLFYRGKYGQMDAAV